jgi:SAM-dependent methyltransferase
MSSYASLAFSYDALTRDVDYVKRADYIEKLFERSRIPVKLVLDLACGTGTMTKELAMRGYETIGADASEDMLSVAAEKCGDMRGMKPVFLHQDMRRLDLYGTVDAVVCCLDSINYITDAKGLGEALRRVRLFLAPGGVFVFDINTEEKLRGLDGQMFVDENEDTFCVWRASYGKRNRICTYGMDIFTRYGDMWERAQEEHRERAWGVAELRGYLESAGFEDIRVFGDMKLRAPSKGEQRAVFSCIRSE